MRSGSSLLRQGGTWAAAPGADQADGEEFRFTIKSQDIGDPDLVARTGTER